MTEISDKDRARAQAACVAYWAALGDHAPVRVEDCAVPGWLAVLDMGKRDADERLGRKVRRLKAERDVAGVTFDAAEVALVARAARAEARVRVLEAEASSQVNTPQSPVVLPEMTDEDARACCEGYCEAFSAPWAQRSDRLRWARAVQAVRDSLAARMPVWQPVEPGTVIKAGTAYRIDWQPGRFNVYPPARYDIAADDPYEDDRTWSIDPRTVPAEPEDPRVALLLDWYVDAEPSGVNADDARDLLARLDAARGQ